MLDLVARLLARSNLVRAAMRLAFLAERGAPPYDKHLFRLLPSLGHGSEVEGLVRQFLSATAQEETTYAQVGATCDWHTMYRVAAGTPACDFHREVLQLLG